jgi:hypothetical protein
VGWRAHFNGDAHLAAFLPAPPNVFSGLRPRLVPHLKIGASGLFATHNNNTNMLYEAAHLSRSNPLDRCALGWVEVGLSRATAFVDPVWLLLELRGFAAKAPIIGVGFPVGTYTYQWVKTRFPPDAATQKPVAL